VDRRVLLVKETPSPLQILRFYTAAVMMHLKSISRLIKQLHTFGGVHLTVVYEGMHREPCDQSPVH